MKAPDTLSYFTLASNRLKANLSFQKFFLVHDQSNALLFLKDINSPLLNDAVNNDIFNRYLLVCSKAALFKRGYSHSRKVLSADGCTDIRAPSRIMAPNDSCSSYNTISLTENRPLRVRTHNLGLVPSTQFSGRLSRWYLAIADANIEITYREGKKNFLPDLLSRLPNDNNKQIKSDSIEYALSLSANNATILSLSLSSPSTLSTSSTSSYFPNPNNNNTVQDELLVFTEDKLINEVLNDEKLKLIYKYLLEEILPNDSDFARKVIIESESYVLIDNILVKSTAHIKNKKTETLSNMQIVIPETLKELILQIFHDDLTTGGHYGFFKTYNKINERFYWRGMIHDIKVCNSS
ncbi:hypothetical protein ACTFIW_000794 [Dictyostelium discoideum]